MPDRWRETRVRKVLRPAISIQVFLVSLCLLSKCWDGSPVSKLSLHASHVALPKYILVSERLHVCCIRVINLCHRVPTQLQLNKYYYYFNLFLQSETTCLTKRNNWQILHTYVDFQYFGKRNVEILE